MEQITSSYVKQALNEVIGGEETGKDTETENDDDDSSSDEDDAATGKGKKRKNKKNKKIKKDKDEKIPKKAFKKMIKKELDKQCSQIFESMFNGNTNQTVAHAQPVVEDQINSMSDTATTINPQSVQHPNVECDGCGQAPIIGPRYKCTVRKDFDYCSTCEETKNHPHPFIKINQPGTAPTAIFTVIDEDTPGKADIERDVEENPTFFRNRGPCGGMGGMGGMGPGPQMF